MDALDPPIEKRASEELLLSIDFAPELDIGETLSGTPTVTPESGSGITVASIQIVGDKVQAKYSGGTAQLRPWCITVTTTVVHDINPDQTFVREVYLQVLEDC